MRHINLIVIHASATSEDMDIGWDEIRHLHTAPKTEKVQWGNKKIPGKGWNDGGYHDVIRRDGRVEKGRRIETIGAHARGHNAHSIGVCLIGGVDVDDKSKAEFNFTRPQMASLNELLDLYRIEFPDAEVKGHNELPGVNKACPCFDVKSYNVFERRPI